MQLLGPIHRVVLSHLPHLLFFSIFVHSHVTLSVTKLLGRIVNPAEVSRTKGPDHKFASALHGKSTMPATVGTPSDRSHHCTFLLDHTFGITSDPLTHFAAVFSALIHDL